MPSVGSYLRELRTQRGISLEEIARFSRVLGGYLEALEADQFSTLPAPVFTKGFIRAYCQALGVPPDEALALYEHHDSDASEEKPAPGPGRPAQNLAEATPRREAATHRNRGPVFAGFVMLVVLGVALFAMTRWLQPAPESRSVESAAAPAGPQASAPAGPPPRLSAPVQTPVAAAPPWAAAATPPSRPEAPPPVVGVTAPYRLVARTSERTWLRVRTGDGRSSEENIPAGETREWVSNRPFVLAIGNAGGVALELNGRRIPKLGPSGAVIERLVLPSDGQ